MSLGLIWAGFQLHQPLLMLRNPDLVPGGLGCMFQARACVWCFSAALQSAYKSSREVKGS